MLFRSKNQHLIPTGMRLLVMLPAIPPQIFEVVALKLPSEDVITQMMRVASKFAASRKLALTQRPDLDRQPHISPVRRIFNVM